VYTISFLFHYHRHTYVHTSDICYAKHAGMADLLHATLIGVEWTSAGHRA
jgi:hypothetical protein